MFPARRNEDDGCQLGEAAVTGRALPSVGARDEPTSARCLRGGLTTSHTARRRAGGIPKAARTADMQKMLNWIDARFPLTAAWESLWGKYVAPKNFNFWYHFGALAGLVLVLQIVTGIFLAMNYKPDATKAFDSVEYIMRDVEWGWLIRYMHSTGASLFFVVIYLHMFRGLMYGSYRKPRELVWTLACLTYLALIGE